ncbi:uncharacterized protein BYT42DRAFT_106127 [Radiomyces spectabilis]|uniref:uncharacterized protein n=1 Tax=Radiomyces spectabilis TaxID=64574 RepID=UPI00221F2F13|nr:uncharacterized protein BYT42DRAFT_106127 [Radiomyces spectabilis]KAI8369348.1 hypothetical protein BYT42DRAFT_106127 [Radiomyces spectabilis]
MLPRSYTLCFRATKPPIFGVWNVAPIIRPSIVRPTVLRSFHQSSARPPRPQLAFNSPFLQARRVFAHQAKSSPAKPSASKPPNKDLLQHTATETNKERNATDWAIIRQLMKYIWPKNDVGVKSRVVIALGLLIGGKV